MNLIDTDKAFFKHPIIHLYSCPPHKTTKQVLVPHQARTKSFEEIHLDGCLATPRALFDLSSACQNCSPPVWLCANSNNLYSRFGQESVLELLERVRGSGGGNIFFLFFLS